MKKRPIRKWSYVGMMMLIIIGLVGCGPYKVERAVEVDSNSTAFIIPLEMSTLDGQATVVSKEFLDKHKVSAKRIILNQRARKTGRWWWEYEYIPTERVIQVDRTPVTREWITGETKDGKSKSIRVCPKCGVALDEKKVSAKKAAKKAAKKKTATTKTED